MRAPAAGADSNDWHGCNTEKIHTKHAPYAFIITLLSTVMPQNLLCHRLEDRRVLKTVIFFLSLCNSFPVANLGFLFLFFLPSPG